MPIYEDDFDRRWSILDLFGASLFGSVKNNNGEINGAATVFF